MEYIIHLTEKCNLNCTYCYENKRNKDISFENIKNVVNNVVFPAVDMILAILFFVKLATAYMDYRKHGQFEFTAPAILFGCLVFSLTAPLYIWTVL